MEGIIMILIFIYYFDLLKDEIKKNRNAIHALNDKKIKNEEI